MGKAFIKVLLKFIKTIADLILGPINALVVNFVPDLTQMISSFNSGLNRILGGGLGFFSHFIPPYTRTLILFYLGFLITYYTIVVSVHAVLKVIEIIKAIKIW